MYGFSVNQDEPTQQIDFNDVIDHFALKVQRLFLWGFIFTFSLSKDGKSSLSRSWETFACVPEYQLQLAHNC
jgi:hypothetical protein